MTELVRVAMTGVAPSKFLGPFYFFLLFLDQAYVDDATGLMSFVKIEQRAFKHNKRC